MTSQLNTKFQFSDIFLPEVEIQKWPENKGDKKLKRFFPKIFVSNPAFLKSYMFKF